MSIAPPRTLILWLTILIAIAAPVRAAIVSMSGSGTISLNSSTDTTIPVGTPWAFELIYNTAAPDTDFELTGTPDPAFGRFTNSGAIPALNFFHYKAGSYEVTLDDPGDFGPFSAILISFGGTHAIDVNINAAGFFPPLAGGAASFHLDFNDFSPSIFTSDALPTDTSLGLQSFQEGSVTLLPPSGAILGTLSGMTRLTFSPVPEPSPCTLALVALPALLLNRRRPRSN